jgi:hypothetical protein
MDAIVLLKYPAFIVLLVRDVSFESAAAASTVFALACAYEVWHASPSRPASAGPSTRTLL